MTRTVTRISFAFIRSVDSMEKALGAMDKFRLKVVTRVQLLSFMVYLHRPVIDVQRVSLDIPKRMNMMIKVHYIFVCLRKKR